MIRLILDIYFSINILIVLYSLLRYDTKYKSFGVYLLAVFMFIIWGIPILIIFKMFNLHLKRKGAI